MASIETASSGLAWVCGDKSTIKLLVKSFGEKYKPKRVVIVAEHKIQTNLNLVNLVGAHIVAWAPTTEVILESMPLPLLLNFIVADRVAATFVIRLADNERGKFALLCINANGFALSSGELSELMRRNVTTESRLTEKSFKMKSLKKDRVFAQMMKKLPKMITVPIDVIQCSDIKLVFLANCKPSIVEYIKMCADLFSLQVEIVNGNDKSPAWPVEWTAQEATMHTRLREYHKRGTINPPAVLFCISDDGLQMAAASIDKKKNLNLLSDQEVCTLVLWWTSEMQQFEVEYSHFRATNPIDQTEGSTAQVAQSTAAVASTEMVIVGKQELCNAIQIARLAEDVKAKVISVDRTDQVLAAVRELFESSGSCWPKFVFAADSRGRYLCAGGRTWDAVAVTIQLAQIAIYSKAICRCTLRQLLDRLQLLYGK